MRARITLIAAVGVCLACAGAGIASAAGAAELDEVAPGVDLEPRPTPPTLQSDEAIFHRIKRLVANGPRRLGTPALELTVDHIARRFRAYGLSDVHIEETPAYSWKATEHSLSFAGSEIDSWPVTYSQSPDRDAVGRASTPPGGLAAPLVDVGLATPAEVAAHDVEGKIVVFDLKFLLPLVGLLPVTEFLWDPGNTMATSPDTMLRANPYITTFSDAVEAAMEAGAVGFVGVLGDYFDSNRYYNEFYRSLVVPIPGLWVTKGEGERLRALLDERPDEPARLVMESRRRQVEAHAVVGYLQGRSDDAIMIQSHHDSGFQGAVEDASGVAEVLALAKHYGAQPASSREKSLMFTTFDSHWGGYVAHFAFARRHITHRNPARDPHRIVANVTLEHIARAASIGADRQLAVSGLPEPRGVFENLSAPLKGELIGSVVRNDLRRTAILNGSAFHGIGIPTDASAILAAGVPTASLISGPLYLYDAADTLDKVARDELQKVAKAFVELVDAIDETPSEEIGALPPAIVDPLGVIVIENLGGERGTEESGDRPACKPKQHGKPVRSILLRRGGPRAELRFVSRRSGPVEIRVGYRDGGSDALSRPRQLRACRRYVIPLPRRVTSARIAGPGGFVRVSR